MPLVLKISRNTRPSLDGEEVEQYFTCFQYSSGSPFAMILNLLVAWYCGMSYVSSGTCAGPLLTIFRHTPAVAVCCKEIDKTGDCKSV